MQVAGCQRLAQNLRQQPAYTMQVTRRTRFRRRQQKPLAVTAYKVDINVNGRTEVLEVAEDQTILEVALEQGIELSHDCKMGVCMTCPAKLVSRKTHSDFGQALAVSHCRTSQHTWLLQ